MSGRGRRSSASVDFDGFKAISGLEMRFFEGFRRDFWCEAGRRAEGEAAGALRGCAPPRGPGADPSGGRGLSKRSLALLLEL